MQNKKHKVDPTAQEKYFPPAASGSRFLLLENICVGFLTYFHSQNANHMYEEYCKWTVWAWEKTKMKIGVREPRNKEPRIKMA